MVIPVLPLKVRGVSVRRGARHLLGPIDLTIEGTGLTMVLGPNGSGKTTLLKVMHGLERPSEGKISYGLARAEAERRQAYVFQTPIVLRRSVQQNLAYPLELIGRPRDEIRRRAGEWAERIGLGGALSSPATRLSGGEKQKLALARALIRKPELLFLDEPCANLDGRSTRAIEEMLLEARAAGTRIVMATHDIAQARRLATDAILLINGAVHETGEAPGFFDAPVTSETKSFLKGDIIL